MPDPQETVDLTINGTPVSAPKGQLVIEAAEEHGIFIRMPGLPPLNRCVRVTIGTASDRAAFAEAFRQVLKRV